MKRATLPKEKPAVDGGLFLPSRSARPFFSTGCYMVDLQFGGGYCEGQIIKLRGDSQTGKSLFAIEGAANFLHAHPKGRVRYLDRENAFDQAYVDSLGIPADRFDRPTGLSTIEAVTADIVRHLEAFSANRTESQRRKDAAAKKAAKKKAGKKKASKKKSTKVDQSLPVCDDPMLYVVDSWDGLSDDAELDRDVGNHSTYAMSKQKKGHELARRVQSLCEGVPFTLMIVTQNRWKQSAMPGLPARRSNSGGSWLDFYPTQVLDLATAEHIQNTRKGHDRKYGRWVKVMSEKNRRSGPQHHVMVPIMFRYGVCDLSACVRYLIDENGWALMFDTREIAVAYLGSIWKLGDAFYERDLARARRHAGDLFQEIEALFRPKRRKYGTRSR